MDPREIEMTQPLEEIPWEEEFEGKEHLLDDDRRLTKEEARVVDAYTTYTAKLVDFLF